MKILNKDVDSERMEELEKIIALTPKRREQILNWEADRLEGMFYQCNDCEYINHEKPLANGDVEGFPCKCDKCKYITQYNNIQLKIKNRTQPL
jgi:hypothetical protein